MSPVRVLTGGAAVSLRSVKAITSIFRLVYAILVVSLGDLCVLFMVVSERYINQVSRPS